MPIDLMTSELRNERRLKVEAEILAETGGSLELLLLRLISVSSSENQSERILEQLKLLNLRFEETFNTGLNESDLDG